MAAPPPAPAPPAADRPPLPTRALRRIGWFLYAVALAVVVTLAAALVAHGQADEQHRQALLAAIVLAALFGGWVAGLAAWGMSFYVVGWPGRVVEWREPLVVALSAPHYAVVSLVVAVVTSWFSTRYRRTNALLREAKGDLEQRVARRTSDLGSAVRMLRREIALRRTTEEEVRSVTAHARCILWRAELAGSLAEHRARGASGYVPSWTVHVQDENAAQQVLPLDVPPGSSYYKTWTQSRHPADAPLIGRRCLDAVLGGKSGYTHEYRCVDRHGMLRWLSEDVRIRPMGAGRWQLIGVTTDVSESKWAAEALRASEERFSLFMENLPGLAFIKDDAGRYVFMNRACEDWFGLVDGSWVDRRASEVHGAELVRRFAATERLVIAGARSTESTEVLDAPDGGRRFFVFTWFPIRSRDGACVMVGAVGIDITDRKRAEEALIANQEKLRAMSANASATEERERRQIAAALHDQIGSTLAAVQIRLQLLETTDDDADGADGFARSARRAIPDLVRDLERAIAHTRSLTCELSPPLLYEAGMEAAVRWLCDQVRYRYGLAVSVVSEGPVESLDQGLKVVAYQGVRELLSNVVKHARASTVRVRLSCDAGGFQAEVSDNGIGLSLATARRADSFGLFNLRERLGYLGGGLALEPAVAGGTRATIALPVPVAGGA